jgi:hypothetical protein
MPIIFSVTRLPKPPIPAQRGTEPPCIACGNGVGCPGQFVSGRIPWLTPGVTTPSRQGGHSGIELPLTNRWDTLVVAEPPCVERRDWQAEPPGPPQQIRHFKSGGTGGFACRTTFSAAWSACGQSTCRCEKPITTLSNYFPQSYQPLPAGAHQKSLHSAAILTAESN